ncbi:hypothetical protein KC887_04370 [Candidatus Kaiserbacteria bacterium]|nr:hypothetical protein [Candidatus Kaiserbacteria bacterium]
MTGQFDQADNINPTKVYGSMVELLETIPATPNRTFYLMNGAGEISSHSYHMTDDRSAKVWWHGVCRGFDQPTYKELKECGMCLHYGRGWAENYRLLVH